MQPRAYTLARAVKAPKPAPLRVHPPAHKADRQQLPPQPRRNAPWIFEGEEGGARPLHKAASSPPPPGGFASPALAGGNQPNPTIPNHTLTHDHNTHTPRRTATMPPKAAKKPTFDYIKEAILALKERGGSSPAAIKAWIAKTYPGANIAPHVIKAAFKSGVTSGKLQKVRGSVLGRGRGMGWEGAGGWSGTRAPGC